MASGGASLRVTVRASPLRLWVAGVLLQGLEPGVLGVGAAVVPLGEGLDVVPEHRVGLVELPVLVAALLDEVGELQQRGVRTDVGALGRVEAGEEDQPGEGEDPDGQHTHGAEPASGGGVAVPGGGVGASPGEVAGPGLRGGAGTSLGGVG